jgi:multiple sugar transport system permease protein
MTPPVSSEPASRTLRGTAGKSSGALTRLPARRPRLIRPGKWPEQVGHVRRLGGHPGYRRKVIIWLVGPAVLCQLLVYALPVLVGIYTSFTGVNFSTIRTWLGAPFVGVQNYRLILATSAIADPLLRSFVLSMIYVTIVVACSLALATLAVVLVRTLGGRVARILQTLYILPFTIPIFAGVLTWDFIFQGNGAATELLSKDLHLFGSGTLWLDGSDAFWAMVVTTIWRSWPFAFLMLLAASQQIPGELYEAVRIDGGGRWAEARSITVPYLRHTLVTLSMILFLWTFNDFTTPYVFFGGIPPKDADLFPLHVYTSTFVNASYSLGSAMTIVAVLALLLIAIPYGRTSGLLGERNA